MSAYITQSDIETRISPPDLIAALDDTNSGTLNTAVLDRIISNASTTVDGRLSEIYQVPFNPVPDGVFDSTLDIACYMIFVRTKAGRESNPFVDEYKDAMKWLDNVANGNIGLDQSVSRAFSPAYFVGGCISTWGTTA